MQKIILRRLRPLIILLSALAGLPACQDPTTIGYDLLDQEQVNLATDTLQLDAVTVLADSVRTFSPTLAAQLNSYLFGRMQDPLFGLAESSVYFQVRPEVNNPGFDDAAVLDSVVLVLPYDTSGLYGPLAEPFGIEVLRVTETMNRTQEYYSDATFAVDPAPLVTREFVPNLDSLEVIEYLSATVRDTVSFPQLRIHLDPAFGQELLNLDTNLLKSDSAFLSYLPGLHLRPTRTTPGMLSFNIRNQPYRGGIYLYYTQDTVKRMFQFEVDEFSTRLTHFEHDYAAAPVSTFIGDAEAGDSLLFVQGMAGVNVQITLPDLSEYENVIINKAELLVTLSDLVTDPYAPPQQLALFVLQPDDDLLPVADLLLAAAQGRISTVFGGTLDSKNRTYAMNISSYFQEAIAGAEPKTLILTLAPSPETLTRYIVYGAGPSAQAETAARAVLYGPGNPVKGLKIRLAFTKL